MHPTNRAERRYQRDRVIAYRRFIREHIWYNWTTLESVESGWFSRTGLENFEWGRYSKFNLNCACKICRARKQYSRYGARRRKMLTQAKSQAEYRSIRK